MAGSFLEFDDVTDRLVAAGHDVVIPSLPGLAFSGHLEQLIGPKGIAVQFDQLMQRLFGTRQYLVQGGDWGSVIAAWMAHQCNDSVRALHLNMVSVHAADVVAQGAVETAWTAQKADLAFPVTGYSHLQGTVPQSLAFAMFDNPVGVAAWIIEKFSRWSDRPAAATENRNGLDDDFLITNIMLYLIDNGFVTSTWIYKACFAEGSFQFPAGTLIHTPTGIAAFPDPAFPPPPRS